MTWIPRDETHFAARLGRILVRRESERGARCRMLPDAGIANVVGNVHGGATLALIDVALGAAVEVLEIDAGDAVTFDLATHFIGAGRICDPLDAVIDVLRETGRFVFLRGLVVQDEHLVASFTATMLKPRRTAATP